ncbi:major facilitator superfamily domain-containing protein [Amylocarpus encephaloides]|uniref:Major facilitator superfamily domain-containing protein n=1 Tax=Amylocarpus encephaloides TaxID=45428 RepID=A0A9P7YER8_9HELO|nr:major facilitator superfamily domain-containing protein [Amylocarpus encephaloides]
MAALTPIIEASTPNSPHNLHLEKDSEEDYSIHTTSSTLEHDLEHNATNEKGVQEMGAVTRTSTKSSWKDPGPPPDGGMTAWMQVVFGHLVIMNTWGFINSFGVFQTYYTTTLSRPPSDISWIGSIQVFLLFFVGTFSGRLTDAGYFRPVFLTGSILGVLGLFMTSLSTKYYQLFLAQGVCCGLGNGLIFCPTLSITSTYFSKKRSLAIGIAAAGSATGGVIFPLMVQQLLPKIGFGWTIRALAFIELGCLAICNLGMRSRVPPRRTGALIDVASFKDVPYILFGIGMFFTFWGVYVAFYYIGSFARNIIGVPYAESINLLVVMNGVGLLGRVVPNHIADRYMGPLNVLIPAGAISSLMSFAWMGVNSRRGLYAWSVIYGLSGATIQGLFPATLTTLTTDLKKTGTRMGQVFTVVSFAVLTGPPIAGQLIQAKDGEYEYAQIFTGLSLAIGCGFLISARMVRSKKLMMKM